MKRFLRLAALGMAILPTAVFADTAASTPADPPGRPQLTDVQRGQLETSMRQSMAQMEQLHVQERSAIIGSLTPAHRAALVSILGNLALTPSPNRELVARQIDAMLTQNEARSILTTHMQARTQEKSLRDSQRQAFLSVLTPDQRTAMDARRAQFESAHPNGAGRDGRMGAMGDQRQGMANRTEDAGHVLLMLTGGGGHERGMMEHGMGGPPPGGPAPI